MRHVPTLSPVSAEVKPNAILFRAEEWVWMMGISGGFLLFGDTYLIGERTPMLDSIQPSSLIFATAKFLPDGSTEIDYLFPVTLECNGRPVCAAQLMREKRLAETAQALVGSLLLRLSAST